MASTNYEERFETFQTNYRLFLQNAGYAIGIILNDYEYK